MAGRISGSRLILVGIGVNAVLTAATTFLLTRAEIHDASRAMLWMTGSVYASDWSDVRVLAASLAVLAPVGAVLDVVPEGAPAGRRHRPVAGDAGGARPGWP